MLKSPGRRKEIVASLAKKFDIRIQNQSRAGSYAETLFQEQKKLLLEFLDQPDRSYTIPGGKGHWYAGKVEGQRQYIQKRYLLLISLLWLLIN